MTVNDPPIVAVMKMAGGHEGAFRICTEIIKRGIVIDPKGMGGFSILFYLDSFGVYGARLERLYSDVCGGDLVKLIACLRGWEYGIITEYTLRGAIDGRYQLDVDAVLEFVRERLGDFGGKGPSPSTKVASVGLDRVIYLD